MPSYQPVEAVLRSLQILEVLSGSGQASVASLHAATGLNRATIVRMLETLIFAGYVTRDAQPGRYALTSKVLGLKAGFRVGAEIARLCGPVLQTLQGQVGWPCDVAVLDGNEMVIIGNSPKQQRLSFNRPPGFRAPVFGTSLGMAYMAFASEQERAAALAFYATRPEPWNDMARDVQAAEALFDKVRARGFAVMDPRLSAHHYDGNLGTIGVPVLVGGRSVAAMNIIFLSEVIGGEEAERRLLPPLQAAAASLAEAAAPLYDL